MKHNNFSFLVGEGTKAIFKHGFMSFAAVCITVACLVIVTSFGLITYNIGLIVDDLQKENEVLICIDESYTEAEAKSVGSPYQSDRQCRGCPLHLPRGGSADVRQGI